MAELLIELFSEEIPARMQARAVEDFARLMESGLKTAGLTFDTIRGYVTPRRLTLRIDGLPIAQPDVREERRGPKADAPAAAVQGFLNAVGLSLDQVERRETPKGIFLFAVIEKKGGETRLALPSILSKAITSMPWPKSMRWGDGQFAWVRPLHRILAVFDGAPLDGSIDLGNRVLSFGHMTSGHRFRAPEPFEVSDYADYQGKLRAAQVMLDPEERREVILRDARRLAEDAGLRLRDDPGLLEEVIGLVEWPVPLLGRIDDVYMDLPMEVLTTSMRAHQKYFALEDGQGNLAPYFVVIANGTFPDAAEAVVKGNERVLRARLSDARFFWDQDRAVRLDARIDALESRIFHARLGSDLERVNRIRKLSDTIARLWELPDLTLVDRAAMLAKADLTTGMVGEFPELQGVMGAYYARHDGEANDVAEAIRCHYAPLGPNDACPSNPVAVTVALADKLDTLAGFWLIGEKPTGSKDPFALRRAALGVIRLIVENNVRVPLGQLIDAAAEGHRAQHDFQTPAITTDLMTFFAERLKVRERERGLRHDLIQAVFSRGAQDDVSDTGFADPTSKTANSTSMDDDLVRILARATALSAFVASPAGADLLTAYKRAMNIVRIETKKDGAFPFGVPDPRVFEQDEERALLAVLADVGEKMKPLLDAEAFPDAMGVLATLREPVDAFFERVTVNADDPALRTNRLRLLARIGATMETVADFSKIEG